MHRANDDDNESLTVLATPVVKRLPAPPLAAIRIRYADQLINPALPWLARPGMSLLLLAIITAIGTFLRFYHLTFPALWNDETLVFWRVCGRYGQMLVPLRTDGFPPLHYSLFWIIGHPIPTDAYVNRWILGWIVGLILFAIFLFAAGFGVAAWVRSRLTAGKAIPWRITGLVIGVLTFAVLIYGMFSTALHPLQDFLLPQTAPAAIQAIYRNAWLRMGAFLAMVGMALVSRTLKLKQSAWPAVGIAVELIGLAMCACAALYTYLLYIEWPNTAMFFPAAWSPGQHQVWLTPWIMRAIPAVFGALNVPAIYFLARQLLPRGTSLVAALFTACSAFMLFYSRDGKMYSDSWLFVTLNLGCLMWWFHTGRSTAWLGWIAAGCAMVGLQATALTIPGFSILLLLTQRVFNYKKLFLFLAGLCLIYAGPAVYYSKFNVWTERVETVGWSTSGLGWVGGFFNGDRTGVEHYQYAASAFLMGYEWPRDDYTSKNSNTPIPDELIDGPETACIEIAAILAIGLLPWPLMLRPRRDLDPAPEPAWRVCLWVMGIVLPISYIFYCISVTGFVSPWRWWYTVRETLGWPGFFVAFSIAGTFVVYTAAHRKHWAALLRFAQFTLVALSLFAICLVIYGVCAPRAAEAFFQYKPWESVWTPRYLGTLWPMVGLGVAAVLMRLPTRPLRSACILFVMLVNLGMFSLRMTLGTEPPIDIQAHDEWLAQDIDRKPSKVHTFDYIAHGGIAVAETALDVHSVKVTAGRYYLVDDSHSLIDDSHGIIPNDPEHRPLSPNVFERTLGYFEQAGFGFNLRQDMGWPQIEHDLKSSPQLEKVIVWTRMGPRLPALVIPDRSAPNVPASEYDNDYLLQQASSLGKDPWRTLFPPGWKLADEKTYTVHNPWDWRTFAFWVRREYVKTGPPKPIANPPLKTLK